MKRVFADTLFWVAVTVPRDSFSRQSEAAFRNLGEVTLYTTDEVLAEFLNALSKLGESMRKKAATVVRQILDDPKVKVRKQSHEGFLKALNFYQSRPDKGYSLVDCGSMVTMRENGIQDVLTADRHFEQEGFTVLIRA